MTTPHSSPRQDLALAYAARGWPVFPLAAGRKTPATAHGLKDATRDQKQIKQWWPRGSRDNIGIVAGKVSGLTVVDLDGPHAASALATMPPRGYSVRTPHGHHLFIQYDPRFRQGAALAVADCNCAHRCQVDIRNDGGYIVSPGSTVTCEREDCDQQHPTEYVAHEGDIPQWDDPPDALTRRSERAAGPAQAQGGRIQSGRRNAELASIAGRLRHAGLDEDGIERHLLRVNRERCDPPLDESEVIGIARSVSRYRPANGPHTNGRQAEPRRNLVVTTMATVAGEPIEWLVPGLIPVGKLTGLEGDPSTNKSLLLCHVAADVSKGRPFVADASGEAYDPGRVLMLSIEDGKSDTLRPRFEPLGADLGMIDLLEGTREESPDSSPKERIFDIAADVDLLDAQLASGRYKLLTVDPINAYLGERDSNSETKIRAVLGPIAKLAERHRVAVIFMRHFTKTARGAALYRGAGSIAYAALARSIIAVQRDPDDPAVRLVSHVKSNLSAEHPTMAFRVASRPTPWGAVPTLEYMGERTESAEDLNREAERDRDDRSSLGEAKAFLVDILKDGPVAVATVKAEAAAADVSEAALKRARALLKGQVGKAKDGPPGRSGQPTWRLFLVQEDHA